MVAGGENRDSKRQIVRCGPGSDKYQYSIRHSDTNWKPVVCGWCAVVAEYICRSSSLLL